ncbi:glycine receptor subunit alphaZ1-like [Glandiceps talaboti]
MQVPLNLVPVAGLLNAYDSLVLLWCGFCHGDGSESHDSSSVKDEHMRIIHEVLKHQEISIFRPDIHGGPVDVECYILLLGLGDINPMSMDYKVDIEFFTQWMDDRLTHNSSVLVFQTVESVKKIWVPDVYFENEKEGHQHAILSENIALVLRPDGNITYSTRLTLTLSCLMHLELFPLDIQRCTIKIKSYAYNSDHVVLRWSDVNALKPYYDFALPQFRIERIATWHQIDSMPLGNYSTLVAELKLERSLGFFIVSLFLPSFLLVIISWISFWLHVDATPARASLGITSVLTLVTQSSSIRWMIPALSYPTAIDLWFTVCITFVFAALLEFSAVNYFYISSVRASKKEPIQGIPEDDENENDTKIDEKECLVLSGDRHGDQEAVELGMRDEKRNQYTITPSVRRKKKRLKRRMESNKLLAIARNIDRICRVVFPLLFAGFASLFWVLYSQKREEIDMQNAHFDP